MQISIPNSTHLDGLVMALLVGTAFAAIAIYQLKNGSVQMKSGKSYDRKARPAVFWL